MNYCCMSSMCRSSNQVVHFQPAHHAVGAAAAALLRQTSLALLFAQLCLMLRLVLQELQPKAGGMTQQHGF
jgi:hypothetical protein